MRCWATRLGQADRLGRLRPRVLPLVGSIVAESGTPKRHRTARLSQASGPLLIQIAGALVGNANDLSLPEALQSGFAPIATLQLSNLLLTGLHGLIPFERLYVFPEAPECAACVT